MESCFEKFILIVSGAERAFHNLIYGVQEATLSTVFKELTFGNKSKNLKI